MNVLVVIGFMAILGVSLTIIFSSIQDNQVLSEINNKVSQNRHTAMSVSSGVSGSVEDGNILFENLLNQDVEIIQIRVYDDKGNFVKSFPFNSTVSGNTSLEFQNLPGELQTILEDLN